jgi:hypothetical protein
LDAAISEDDDEVGSALGASDPTWGEAAAAGFVAAAGGTGFGSEDEAVSATDPTVDSTESTVAAVSAEPDGAIPMPRTEAVSRAPRKAAGHRIKARLDARVTWPRPLMEPPGLASTRELEEIPQIWTNSVPITK